MNTETAETVRPDDATRLAPDHHVFHVWQEDSSYFDGNALYADLETAKAQGAYDYEDSEYGHGDPDEDDPVERPKLSWTAEAGGRWYLVDGDSGTGICVEKRPVYRPATPDEIAAQDKTRAEQQAASAAKYAGMSLSESLETAARERTAENGAPTA